MDSSRKWTLESGWKKSWMPKTNIEIERRKWTSSCSQSRTHSPLKRLSKPFCTLYTRNTPTWEDHNGLHFPVMDVIFLTNDMFWGNGRYICTWNPRDVASKTCCHKHLICNETERLFPSTKTQRKWIWWVDLSGKKRRQRTYIMTRKRAYYMAKGERKVRAPDDGIWFGCP